MGIANARGGMADEVASSGGTAGLTGLLHRESWGGGLPRSGQPEDIPSRLASSSPFEPSGSRKELREGGTKVVKAVRHRATPVMAT